MTTTAHKLATIANNHGLVGLGPYTTAVLRRAAVLTSADVGKVAQQTDTDPATYWIVLKVAAGVGTWSRVDTGAEVVSTGDFGSCFTGVLQYLRSDLGITQTSGNITAWAAQTGPSVTPATGCTYIGTTATGLNGHASIASNAATGHGGQFTLARPAPATTPTFFWLVWRLLSATNTPSYLFMDQSGAMGAYVDNGATNFKTPGGLALTGPTNVWGRSEVSFVGTASSSIRFGTPAKTSGDIGNTAPNSLRGIFCTNLGGNKISAELLAMVTLDNVPSAGQLSAADAMVTAFYGSGNVQI